MSDAKHVALTKCYFCGEGNEIVLAKYPTHPHPCVAEMNGAVTSMRPCSKCEGLMKAGVIIITIDPEKSERDWNKPKPGQERFIPNPYRSGGWFVVTDEYIKRLMGVNSKASEFALKRRFVFMEHEVAEKLGMFRLAAKEKGGA